MSALRISTGADTKIYLTREKEADFLAWLPKQLETLEKQIPIDSKRYWRYLRAVNNMSVKPIVQQPAVKESQTEPDVWSVSDSEMHEVACKMARKRKVKDADTALMDMVVAIVRKNMKEK